jgi:diacylglycerol kinase family enzyme
MQVRPSLRQTTTALPLVAPAQPHVAVLLNANARHVGARMVESLTHVVSENDLYVSRSPLEARAIARKVVERGYDTVFCGGGDGTFMTFATELINESQRAHSKMPRLGVLRLGTGNGLASMVNASPARGDKLLDDVLRARASEVPGYRKLDLVMVNGKRTPFAGLGVDGRVLNDFVWVKAQWGRGVMKRFFSGKAGYFCAGALRTLPHYATHPLFAECTVVNGAYPAYRLDNEGQVIFEHEPGSILFRGRLMMAAVATIPYYGFDFRMFPFAGKQRRMMQLRLGALSPAEVVTHLPSLWRGEYFPGNRIQDFQISEATVRFDRPMPLQIGGDAEGEREQVTFSMAPEQLELLDFSERPRLEHWQ